MGGGGGLSRANKQRSIKEVVEEKKEGRSGNKGGMNTGYWHFRTICVKIESSKDHKSRENRFK